MNPFTFINHQVPASSLIKSAINSLKLIFKWIFKYFNKVYIKGIVSSINLPLSVLIIVQEPIILGVVTYFYISGQLSLLLKSLL